jgi:hypothetical protein
MVCSEVCCYCQEFDQCEEVVLQLLVYAWLHGVHMAALLCVLLAAVAVSDDDFAVVS